MAAQDASRLYALSGLIERIYAAATDPALWPEVLNDVGRAVSDGTQTLLFVAGREQLPGVLRCQRTPDSVLFPFLEYYSSVNILAEPCDRIFPDGTVRFSHVAVSDQDFERSEFYAEFFRRNHLFYSCGIKHSTANGGSEYLSMQREKTLDPFTAQEGSILELLMPHIRRALTVQAQLTAQANQIHMAESALSAFGKAVLAVNAAGHLSFATAAAETLFATADPLYVRNGRLRAKDPRIDEQLQGRIQSVLGFASGFVESRGKALLVPRRPSMLHANEGVATRQRVAENLKLVFLPMRNAGLSVHSAPGALITISGDSLDEQHNTGSREAVLRELFSLSPTEARIAGLLAEGSDVTSIATLLKKSETATRFHLKQIFQKTGTGRQTDLLRLITTLPFTA